VISRRRLHLLIALLLPLMVVRGMLPAGYMASAEGGKLRIVMCSAGLAPADTRGGTDSGDQTVPDPGHCLFAHAATLVPPVQAQLATVAVPETVQFSSLESTTLPPATGPPRTAAARAPPALRI
jgi:hypothetical protein